MEPTKSTFVVESFVNIMYVVLTYKELKTSVKPLQRVDPAFAATMCVK